MKNVYYILSKSKKKKNSGPGGYDLVNHGEHKRYYIWSETQVVRFPLYI